MGRGFRLTLPTNCAACTMWQSELCRRHAPGTTKKAMVVAYWPQKLATERCGVGSVSTPPVRCMHCVHWWKLPEEALPPKTFTAKPRLGTWTIDYSVTGIEWEKMGLCTRFAPSPGPERPSRSHHFLTHEQDMCGDGEDCRGNDSPAEISTER
jgi:hypothetical protein